MIGAVPLKINQKFIICSFFKENDTNLSYIFETEI